MITYTLAETESGSPILFDIDDQDVWEWLKINSHLSLYERVNKIRHQFTNYDVLIKIYCAESDYLLIHGRCNKIIKKHFNLIPKPSPEQLAQELAQEQQEKEMLRSLKIGDRCKIIRTGATGEITNKNEKYIKVLENWYKPSSIELLCPQSDQNF